MSAHSDSCSHHPPQRSGEETSSLPLSSAQTAGPQAAKPGAHGQPGHQHGTHHHAHHHDSHHHSSHHHGLGAGTRTLLLALALSLGFALIEALGAWLTGSLALLSDAGHMVSDSLALAIAAAAARLALRPPSARHSYGLGRVEPMAALANALLMLLIVAGIAWEAAQRLHQPQVINAGPAAVIAAVGLGVNLFTAWWLARGESTLNVRAALLHVLGDVLGSVAAILALLIVYFTGWTAADPLLSLLVCGLILASTLSLLRESTHQLLDGVPQGISLRELGQALLGIDGVVSVHDLHVWHIAPGKIALSAHLLIPEAARWGLVLVAARHLVQRDFHIAHTTFQPELPPADRVPLSHITRPRTADQR